MSINVNIDGQISNVSNNNVQQASYSRNASSVEYEQPTKSSQQPEENQQFIDQDLIDKSLQQANKNLASSHRYINREVHEVTKAIIYTIVDSDTNQVIAEIPPRKIQDAVAKMWEIVGLFVDKKA